MNGVTSALRKRIISFPKSTPGRTGEARDSDKGYMSRNDAPKEAKGGDYWHAPLS